MQGTSPVHVGRACKASRLVPAKTRIRAMIRRELNLVSRIWLLHLDPSNGNEKLWALFVSELACALCHVHVGRTCYAWMLAPAKKRIRLGWNLASLICRIKTHRIATRNLRTHPVSERARWPCKVHVFRSCYAQMHAQAKPPIGREWDLAAWICRMETHWMTWVSMILRRFCSWAKACRSSGGYSIFNPNA